MTKTLNSVLLNSDCASEQLRELGFSLMTWDRARTEMDTQDNGTGMDGKSVGMSVRLQANCRMKISSSALPLASGKVRGDHVSILSIITANKSP